MCENANTDDVEMSNAEMGFDNLTILKELSNIANLVSDEEFLEIVPKAKHKRVKWVPMFNRLKQDILDSMIQELNVMWQDEDMPRKLELLEKQKEKFTNKNIEEPVWRPQLGDVKSQLRANDVAILRKQKLALESLAKEYEARVDCMKKVITAKRGYLKALQIDMQNYQKKNEDVISHIDERFRTHNNLNKTIIPSKQNVNDMNWSVSSYTDSDINNTQ